MTDASQAPPRTPVALCITGMHRSGTSLTASWFERCGLPISDGEMLGAYVGNPYGHFEDVDFFRLQERSMNRQRGSWRVTDPAPLQFDPSELKHAQALVAARNARFERWGWKEPRSLYFFHEWKRLKPNLKGLILWRSCEEVVRSLTARATAKLRRHTMIDPFTAARAWTAHNRLALSLVRDFPNDVALISVRALVAHDREVLEHCNRVWGLGLTYVPIAELRDESLLETRTTAFSRLAKRWVNAEAMEQTLSAASLIVR